MPNITFHFALLFCIFAKSAIAQISRNDANISAARLVSEKSLTNVTPFPIVHNKCEVTSGCFYSNLKSFPCGKNEVVISSTCVSNDEFNSDPYCFIQNVVFVNRLLRRAKSYSYYYEADSQKYIYGAMCIKAGSEFYIALENTNLSNCKICEWSDYFDKRGKYIGSENGRYGRTSFPRKLVPLKNKEMIQKGKSMHHIDITTIAQ